MSVAGKYYEALPVDRLILDKLPDKGMIGGVHWKGRRVRDLVAELRDEVGDEAKASITHSFIQSRLRSMNVAGLVEPFPAAGTAGVKIWARIPTAADDSRVDRERHLRSIDAPVSQEVRHG